MHANLSRVRHCVPLILCALALLLTACGGNQGSTSTTKASEDKQVFQHAISGISDVATLDPALATDGSSTSAINMLFTGLVQLNDKLEVYGQLAQSWEQSGDGLTWTFKLKPNQTFSDGTPLTSQDVIWSIDRAFDPAIKSSSVSFYLSLIKDGDKRSSGKVATLINDSLFAPDASTVKIVITKKAPYFLQALTYPSSWVVEKKLIEKYGNQKFLDHLGEGGGAGPWIVQSYTHGKEIVFAPNPHYNGAKPQLKKVIFSFYKDAPTTFKAYQVGQTDDSPVPTANMNQAKGFEQQQLHINPALTISYYTMNYLVKPFDNIKVRQAFALALNKDQIAHNVRKDTVVATNHIIPKGQPGYYENLTGPAGITSTQGDQAKAKQLFAEGLKEEGMTLASLPKISFTVATSGSPDTKNEYQVVQQMWKNVLGVDVLINDLDSNQRNQLVGTVQGNPNGLIMWASGWGADYPDPQDWLDMFVDNTNGGNQFNYAHNSSSNVKDQQQTQALIEQADTTSDGAARMQLYNQAEQRLVNDVAWIPMSQTNTLLARKPCVVGIVDNAQGITPPEDWGNIYISTNSLCAKTA
ncbi:peptide ABC transporter substrate-binding protein [Ktedonospora formicarum]|uniref:Oligopeptide-binding protein OppA n=1 Tax=Ktedonospora formicarum TaxID=2778364 RepID=A0A8J3HSE8_9CHLR|nr:peptide ABC transporter substrate-binding protein [Ktedonospora formicarum]GHO42809.1 oligopeptide-binding protein OppA [Ktedonospora formicarum]